MHACTRACTSLAGSTRGSRYSYMICAAATCARYCATSGGPAAQPQPLSIIFGAPRARKAAGMDALAHYDTAGARRGTPARPAELLSSS